MTNHNPRPIKARLEEALNTSNREYALRQERWDEAAIAAADPTTRDLITASINDAQTINGLIWMLLGLEQQHLAMRSRLDDLDARCPFDEDD